MIPNLLKLLPALGRRKKRAILVTYDSMAMLVALWAAFSTRLGMLYIPTGRRVLLAALVSVLIGIASLYRLRIYHIVLRYFDLRTVTRLLAGAAFAAIGWVIFVYLTNAQITVGQYTFEVPRSVAFIYCGFLFLLLFMGRYVMALLLSDADRGQPTLRDAGNVVIYGANAAGISLADSVLKSSQYRLKAFVDPDPAVHGQIAVGVPIYHPDVLPRLAEGGEVQEVFLALPKATRSERLEAISQVRQLNLPVKTVPAPEEIVSGRFTVSDVRPIDVSDLLRRDPVEPVNDLIREAVEGHSILVTGAGGSIGSEICRQVIQNRPGKLVLLDHSEHALYTINEHLGELAEQMAPRDRPEIVPLVGSMMNEAAIGDVLSKHGIDTLYHAAAYKHVPLLEHNELIGIENNVFGTQIVARAAFESKLTRFTMISTDKAVRPTSVMGASKRVAELIIQALAREEGCDTQFGIVRFGNVLDSSGSVVRRFRKQIRAGGPVTVTHKEVARFFMSIPEATHLVLQASAMASSGEVFVLDMGEPVKIIDLARHMINLSGMTVRDEDNPDGDIKISFVGLRPGEKLYEELFIGEDTSPTMHPRIRMARERVMPNDELSKKLARLRATIEQRDSAAVRRLLTEMIEQKEESRDEAVVTPFPARGN